MLLTGLMLVLAVSASAQPATGTFLALAGERVETRQVAYQPGDFNLHFVAKYRIRDRVFGEYGEAEIEFSVYDHYGTPPLFNYATALLYISRSDGEWVLEKYQFHDVYRTSDGRWASCGDPYKWETDFHRGPLKAVPLSFTPRLTFPVSHLSRKEIAERYPPAYFERRGRSWSAARTSQNSYLPSSGTASSRREDSSNEQRRTTTRCN